MNIQEAIKSGKRFKRPTHGSWSYISNSGDLYRVFPLHCWSLKPADLLADDWELEDKTITITESEFRAAYLRAHSKRGKCPTRIDLVEELFK